MGAVSPSRRRPAVKVVVFQWPWGTAARHRSPRFERPRRRAILVVAPVSSMNTSRAGSRSGWNSNQARRRRATSGRSGSAACAVFFEADAAAVKEPPHRTDPDRDAATLQHRLQLGQRDVRRLLDLGQQEMRRRFDPLRATVPTLRARRRATALTPLGNPADRARRANLEPLRRLVPRRPFLNSLNDPNPKILGKRRSHARWPPPPAGILNHMPPSKGIPPDSNRSENALA